MAGYITYNVVKIDQKTDEEVNFIDSFTDPFQAEELAENLDFQNKDERYFYCVDEKWNEWPEDIHR